MSANAAHSAEVIPPKAAEPHDDSSLYTVATIASGLDRPTSLAVRGGAAAVAPFELYIAEAGAGRIIRVTAEADAQPTPVITGYPLSGKDAFYGENVGPLSVAFLTANRLVVGDGGLGNGVDLLRVFALPPSDAEADFSSAAGPIPTPRPEPSAKAELTWSDLDHSAGPVGISNRSTTGEGAFVDLAGSENACFVAPHSGDARGWVLKAIVDANRVAGLEPFVAMADLGAKGRPTAVAVDPRSNHHYLLVATSGELDGSPDSRITMLSPTSGQVALALAPGLRDITAIAYSPTGDLYVADFAVGAPTAGGVYRLEAAAVNGRESCRAVKIASVARPTAIAFTPDGALYVTALGDEGSKAGSVVRITPNDNTPKL